MARTPMIPTRLLRPLAAAAAVVAVACAVQGCSLWLARSAPPQGASRPHSSAPPTKHTAPPAGSPAVAPAYAAGSRAPRDPTDVARPAPPELAAAHSQPAAVSPAPAPEQASAKPPTPEA